MHLLHTKHTYVLSNHGQILQYSFYKILKYNLRFEM